MAVITGAIMLLAGVGFVGEITDNCTDEDNDSEGTETLKSV